MSKQRWQRMQGQQQAYSHTPSLKNRGTLNDMRGWARQRTHSNTPELTHKNKHKHTNKGGDVVGVNMNTNIQCHNIVTEAWKQQTAIEVTWQSESEVKITAYAVLKNSSTPPYYCIKYSLRISCLIWWYEIYRCWYNVNCVFFSTIHI